MIRKNSLQEIKAALVRGDMDQIAGEMQLSYGMVREVLSGSAVFKPEKHKPIVLRAIEIIKQRNERIAIIISEIEDEWNKD